MAEDEQLDEPSRKRTGTVMNCSFKRHVNRSVNHSLIPFFPSIQLRSCSVLWPLPKGLPLDPCSPPKRCLPHDNSFAATLLQATKEEDEEDVSTTRRGGDDNED